MVLGRKDKYRETIINFAPGGCGVRSVRVYAVAQGQNDGWESLGIRQEDA